MNKRELLDAIKALLNFRASDKDALAELEACLKEERYDWEDNLDLFHRFKAKYPAFKKEQTIDSMMNSSRTLL